MNTKLKQLSKPPNSNEVVGEAIATSEDKDKIANLLRFSSTHSDSSEQTVSLADYISRMKEDQDKRSHFEHFIK